MIGRTREATSTGEYNSKNSLILEIVASCSTASLTLEFVSVQKKNRRTNIGFLTLARRGDGHSGSHGVECVIALDSDERFSFPY